MNVLNLLTKQQLEKVTIKSLEKGVTLFRENDECNCIGIVLEGEVSIVSYLNNGNEIIYNTVFPNGIFGNNLVFSSNPFYKGNIITSVDSRIALIYKDDLINLLKTNELFMIEYLKIQSNFSIELNNKIKMLSIDSAEERLYFYMHEHNKIVSYTSITELAKQLFLKRETLSRLLSKLVKEKKIIKKNNTISLI